MFRYEFYKFVEDALSSSTLARRCNYRGEVYNPSSPAVHIQHRFNRPIGAKAGYIALCWNRQFFWGHCPDTSCDSGSASISPGTVPSAYVNELFSHTITWSGLAGNPSLSGLPENFSYNTGTGEITGTPNSPGTYTVVATGVSEDNECPITRAFNLVINPCRVIDAYIDPDDPPDATVDEEYSHIVLINDVTITNWYGLPPGFTFDPITGEIAGEHDTEGAWVVRIEGITEPNLCEIVAEFTLKIKPCDAEDSRIYSLPDYGTLYFGFPMQPIQIFGYRTVGEIELVSVEKCCPTPAPCTPFSSTLPTGISYDSETGLISGQPSDADQCEPQPCHYRLTFKSKSEANDCDVWYQLILYYPCVCPNPYDFDCDDAWISVDETCPGQDILTDYEGLAFFAGEALELQTFNAAILYVTGLPPGLVFTNIDDTPSISGLNPTPGGTWNITIHGIVTAGEWEGCTIKRDIQIVILP